MKLDTTLSVNPPDPAPISAALVDAKKKQQITKDIIEHTLKEEGGLVDHPKDPGGITKFGVSLKAYPQLGRDGIRDLTIEAAVEIYEQDYYAKVAVAKNPGVNVVLFDAAVNSGVTRSIAWAEACCGMPLSKATKPTPALVEAINNIKPFEFIEKYQNRRLQFLQSLTTFKTFGNGWTARCIRVELFAKSMI